MGYKDVLFSNINVYVHKDLHMCGRPTISGQKIWTFLNEFWNTNDLKDDGI